MHVLIFKSSVLLSLAYREGPSGGKNTGDRAGLLDWRGGPGVPGSGASGPGPTSQEAEIGRKRSMRVGEACGVWAPEVQGLLRSR